MPQGYTACSCSTCCPLGPSSTSLQSFFPVCAGACYLWCRTSYLALLNIIKFLLAPISSGNGDSATVKWQHDSNVSATCPGFVSTANFLVISCCPFTYKDVKQCWTPYCPQSTALVNGHQLGFTHHSPKIFNSFRGGGGTGVKAENPHYHVTTVISLCM